MTQKSLATTSAVDLPPELLVRVAVAMDAIAPRLVDGFENAVPAVHRIADAVQAIESSHPVPGYEEQLRSPEDHPVVAKAMAHQVLRLGEERLTQAEPSRMLASAVRALLRAEKSSHLVVSRRAAQIKIALTNSVAKKAFEQACEQAGEISAIYNIEPLLNEVIERQGASREALLTICRKVKPRLPDPRGRSRKLISATHEVFLEVTGRAYTHDPVNEDFIDPATQATRIAFSEPDFDPRPARRRLNKRAARSTN